MKRFTHFLPTSLLLASGLAFAQNPVNGQVRALLRQDLIKSSPENGKVVEIVLPDPKAVMPGDILREETTVTNNSGKMLKNVQVTVPIPQGTEFSGQASINSRWLLLYSADQGKTYSALPTRTVSVTENGKTLTKQVTVPTSAYTNVRWVVTQLKPDESLKLSFRVKVK